MRIAVVCISATLPRRKKSSVVKNWERIGRENQNTERSGERKTEIESVRRA